MNRFQELTKKTAIITIGRISTQFVSFLLLPLYTHILSTEEYGVVDYALVIVSMIIPLCTLMIEQGVFRHLLSANNDAEYRQIISNGFFVMSGLMCVVVILYGRLSRLFDILPGYSTWIVLIIVATSYSNLFLQIARGFKKTADYALGSFLCSVSVITANIICIAYIRMGSNGMLLASFLGNTLCSIWLFFRLRIYKYIGIDVFSKEIIKKELSYSVPLVPNHMSLWVMNSSDRFIVSYILGISQNGILAVSHKFMTAFMALYTTFQIAWHEMGTVHFYDEDRDEFFSDMIKKIIEIFSAICIGIIVVLPIVFDWIIDASYKEAYYNVPIYLMAAMMNVMVGVLGVVYVALKKTVEIAKTTFIAAVINIVVNLCCISRFGLYAASISTFVGYMVVVIYRVIDVRKYLSIKYDIKQLVRVAIVFAITVLIYYYNNICASLMTLLIYCVYMWKVNASDIQAILKWLVSKYSKNR